MLTREITIAMLAIEERDPGITQLKTHGLVCLRETVYLKTQSTFVIAIGQHLSKKAMCSLICLPFHISESKFQKPGLHALKSPSLSRRLQQVPKRVAKTHTCCQIEIDTETPVCNITIWSQPCRCRDSATSNHHDEEASHSSSSRSLVLQRPFFSAGRFRSRDFSHSTLVTLMFMHESSTYLAQGLLMCPSSQQGTLKAALGEKAEHSSRGQSGLLVVRPHQPLTHSGEDQPN